MIGLSLEKVRELAVGKDSEAAVRVLKNNGFGYVETEYPVVRWRRAGELVEVSYRGGRVAKVEKAGAK